MWNISTSYNVTSCSASTNYNCLTIHDDVTSQFNSDVRLVYSTLRHNVDLENSAYSFLYIRIVLFFMSLYSICCHDVSAQ